MNNTVLEYTDIRNTPNEKKLARSYSHKGKGLMVSSFPDPLELNAGAGLLSSVKDLAKFDIAFDQNKLITDSSKKTMLTNTRSNDGTVLPYGLGFFILKHEDLHVIYHYGLQSSYSGIYFKVPEKNLTLILLANSADLTVHWNGDLSNGNIRTTPFIREFLKIFVDK